MKTLLVFLLLSLGSMIQLRGEATMVLFNDDYCKANSSMYQPILVQEVHL